MTPIGAYHLSSGNLNNLLYLEICRIIDVSVMNLLAFSNLISLKRLDVGSNDALATILARTSLPNLKIIAMGGKLNYESIYQLVSGIKTLKELVFFHNIFVPDEALSFLQKQFTKKIIIHKTLYSIEYGVL